MGPELISPAEKGPLTGIQRSARINASIIRGVLRQSFVMSSLASSRSAKDEPSAVVASPLRPLDRFPGLVLDQHHCWVGLAAPDHPVDVALSHRLDRVREKRDQTRSARVPDGWIDDPVQATYSGRFR